MVLGAGEAVAGLAEAVSRIVTTEIANIDLDIKPNGKKKAKAEGKLKMSVKISPLTVMFAIALQNYYETGIWDLGLHILPGMQNTLQDAKKAIVDIVEDLGTGENVERVQDRLSEAFEDKPLIAGSDDAIIYSPAMRIFKELQGIDWGKPFR